MIQANYRHDIDCNYLIITKEDAVDTSSYQVRMLLANEIDRLLPCRIQWVNGQTLFCYEITSRQAMTSFFQGQKIRYQDITSLFKNLITAVKNIRKYLLETEGIILDPQYIFRDGKEDEWYFCYVPYFKQDMAYELRELCEYLLPLIDHKDQEAVNLGYSIYQKAMEENFILEQIEGDLFRSRDMSSPSSVNYVKEEPVEYKQDMLIREKALEDFFKDDPWEEEERFFEEILKKLRILFALDKKKKAKDKNTKKQEKKEKRARKRHSELEEEFGEETTFLVAAPVQTAKFGVLKPLYPSKLPPIRLEKETMLVGKEKNGVDIKIDLSTISRLHGRIRVDGDKVYVSDLNSRNGTYLNGERMQADREYELKHEDELQFADAGYVYQAAVKS